MQLYCTNCVICLYLPSSYAFLQFLPFFILTSICIYCFPNIFHRIFINIYFLACQSVISTIFFDLSTLSLQFCIKDNLVNCHFLYVAQPFLLTFHCLYLIVTWVLRKVFVHLLSKHMNPLLFSLPLLSFLSLLRGQQSWPYWHAGQETLKRYAVHRPRPPFDQFVKLRYSEYRECLWTYYFWHNNNNNNNNNNDYNNNNNDNNNNYYYYYYYY